MQFTLITLTSAFATAVAANPTYNNPPYDACPDGLYSVEQCCATDVLGVADLDCGSRESHTSSLELGGRTPSAKNGNNTASATPSSASNFGDICAAGGKRARCCVIPVAGQAVLCITPAGLGPQ
ncbi:hydrophobin-like protein [Xylaria grammica]|nr:hydrophobin-like protein [Xylaria grammica]